MKTQITRKLVNATSSPKSQISNKQIGQWGPGHHLRKYGNSWHTRRVSRHCQYIYISTVGSRATKTLECCSLNSWNCVRGYSKAVLLHHQHLESRRLTYLLNTSHWALLKTMLHQNVFPHIMFFILNYNSIWKRRQLHHLTLLHNAAILPSHRTL